MEILHKKLEKQKDLLKEREEELVASRNASLRVQRQAAKVPLKASVDINPLVDSKVCIYVRICVCMHKHDFSPSSPHNTPLP